MRVFRLPLHIETLEDRAMLAGDAMSGIAGGDAFFDSHGFESQADVSASNDNSQASLDGSTGVEAGDSSLT